MSALLHPHPGLLLNSARPSPALDSLLSPLVQSGAFAAVAVALVQLSVLGPADGFAVRWLENWLIVWAITFPLAYLFGAAFQRLFRFLSTPAERDEIGGLQVTDIAAVSARATDRHGFSVLRNLKVREDFYRA